MIGQRIHQARKAAGLTLAGLGEQIGLSHTAIQKFEHGKLTPLHPSFWHWPRRAGFVPNIFSGRFLSS